MATYREDLSNGDIPGAMLQLERASATGVIVFRDVDNSRAAVCLAVHDSVKTIEDEMRNSFTGGVSAAFIPWAIKGQLEDLNDRLTEATGASALDMTNPGPVTASKEEMKAYSNNIADHASLFADDVASSARDLADKLAPAWDYTKYIFAAIVVVLILYIVAKKA